MKIEKKHYSCTLPCKSCNSILNINVKNCVQCGDSDPFYFNLLAKQGDIIGYIATSIFILLIIVVVDICTNNSWWWLLLVIPLSLAIFGGINHLISWFIEKRIKITEPYINHLYDISDENDNNKAYMVWKYYYKKLIGNYIWI